jgi:hypothetical protein
MTKTLSSRERLSPQKNQSRDLIYLQQQSDESVKSTSPAVAHSTEQPSIDGLQIIHATTGRVRIRATDGSHNSILETISHNLRQQKGVKEVFVNEQTGSLTIEFDKNRLSLPQMLAILQQLGVKQLQTSPQSQGNTDPFAAWKSPDFWKEQGISLIPLFTGLAVTGGLGISGLASIPVYMLTANATRRVIDSLEPQLTGSKTNKNSQKASEIKRNKSKVEQTSTLETKRSINVDTVNNVTPQPAKITYSVVHAIPGRIRFHVPRVTSDRAYGRRLERLLKIEPQVTNVRVNCDAASVAITYGSGEIPVSHWVSLMQLALKTIPQTNPKKTTTEQQLPEPVELTTTKEQPTQATQETEKMWSDFKSPALSAALSFMASFPLDPVPE